MCELRKMGATFQKIAAMLGVSYATVFTETLSSANDVSHD